jgi:CheY-like chemotaxis protein
MLTVLLIESEPANLIALALILRSFGYSVLEADSADEAVRNCQEHLGPIHVVVTKAILDDENASEVVARLESLCPHIRAVLISDEPADELAVANTSGCAFLRTPFRADALADTIRRLLDGPKKKAASVNGTYGSAAAGEICDKIMAPRLLPSSMPIRSFSEIALAPLPAPVRAALRWSSITISLAAVVFILLLSTRRAQVPAPTRVGSSQSVALTLTGEGNGLRLSWDGSAPGIRPGRCGVLWIADGSTQRRVILDVSQLRAGTVIYWPQTNDVSVRLNISDANKGLGEAVSNSDSIYAPRPAGGSVGPLQQAKTADSRYQQNREREARQHRIAYGRPKRASKYADPMSPGSRQTLPSAREVPESPPVATSPVQRIVQKQILAAPTSPVPKAAAESFSTVTFEAVTESHLGGVMGKMPLLRRLRRAPDFVPPRPVQETTPTVPEELLRTLRTEVPLDVRVYINKSGKVDYAELLSDITAANRDFATLAVFNARHWEFKPARSERRIVPGRAILHYRFGNPLLAISRDQK